MPRAKSEPKRNLLDMARQETDPMSLKMAAVGIGLSAASITISAMPSGATLGQALLGAAVPLFTCAAAMKFLGPHFLAGLARMAIRWRNSGSSAKRPGLLRLQAPLQWLCTSRAYERIFSQVLEDYRGEWTDERRPARRGYLTVIYCFILVGALLGAIRTALGHLLWPMK